MVAIGVIPARYGSTRFPGKPLALVNGKPLLQWVIEGALSSKKLAKIVVATDDKRIADLAKSSGAEAVMTAAELPTGSDRVWAAVRDLKVDVVLNIQGDEPLITGALLDKLVEPFSDLEIQMATLGRPLDHEALSSNTTAKIIVDQNDNALYFSRLPIPYSRVDAKQEKELIGSLKHIGIYAYRKDFLEKFCAQAPVAIERAESLEQLRALYLGAKIRVVRVNHEAWGVDTPDDVQKIERMMRGEA